jgi:hypothetical protein
MWDVATAMVEFRYPLTWIAGVFLLVTAMVELKNLIFDILRKIGLLKSYSSPMGRRKLLRHFIQIKFTHYK